MRRPTDVGDRLRSGPQFTAPRPVLRPVVLGSIPALCAARLCVDLGRCTKARSDADTAMRAKDFEVGGSIGRSVIGLGHDARGNVNNKNGHLFVLDHRNRLRTALGTETYRYDAHGRRVRTSSMYGMCSLDGKLLWQRDEQIGMRYEHIYLNGSVVAIRRRPIGGGDRGCLLLAQRRAGQSDRGDGRTGQYAADDRA